MPKRFDVVVIGGGPAGSIVAMLLARRGCSVAFVDKSRSGRLCVGETLPPQASRVIAELGLSEAFWAQEHRPAPGILSAWGSLELRANDFLFSPYGNGWHINRPKFNAMLVEAAARAGALFFGETGIEECTEDDEGWSIRASQDDIHLTLKCRFVVDASGRRPAAAFGLSRRIVFDRLIAVAGLCPPARGACPSDYTLVESVDEGWFYSALLPCGEYILTYMTDGDLYAAGRKRSSSFFENQLAKAPQTAGRTQPVLATVGLFCAVSSVRDTVARANWLAVGDAARSYDPLCGLGLWTAMSMAAEAAPVISDLLGGNASSLLDYERANHRAFAQYRKAYQAYYSQERRWPESPFWLRRQQLSW
jgi:flavin-dependent dehydrogenase